jgi:hypothetical protein
MYSYSDRKLVQILYNSKTKYTDRTKYTHTSFVLTQGKVEVTASAESLQMNTEFS